MTNEIAAALEIERQYADLCEAFADLPVSAAEALLMLKIDGPTRLGSLGHGSKLTYTLGKLVAAGLIDRWQNPRDRREGVVVLTSTGQTVKAAAIACLTSLAGERTAFLEAAQ